MIAALVLIVILGATAAMQTRSIMRQARLQTAEKVGLLSIATAVTELKSTMSKQSTPDPTCAFTAELRNAIPLFQCRLREGVATLETRSGNPDLGANVIVRRFFAPLRIPTWSEITQACALDCINGAVRNLDPGHDQVRVPANVQTIFSQQSIHIETLEIELPRESNLTILSPFDVVVENVLFDGPAESPRVRLAAYSGLGQARLPGTLGCDRIEAVEIERFGWRSSCGVLQGKAYRTLMSGVSFERFSPNDDRN